MKLGHLQLPDQPECQSITIKDGSIFSLQDTEMEPPLLKEDQFLWFENAIGFPALINSHDHLDFNLFPQIGNRNYEHYVEWGNHIHEHYKKEIDAVLNIPQSLRVQWGIYKNLLNGITTVVNHGAKLAIENPVINVVQQCNSLHSVRLEKNWKLKLNKPLRNNWPFVIHTGEGTGAMASDEIDEVLRWNIRKRKLVAVHGVAMDTTQAKQFDGLVWCPATNIFLLNKTAPVNDLKNETNIVFGTDSTLTASWNIWEHLRLARSVDMLSDIELFQTVTKNPSLLWGLNQQGIIAEGSIANIVIAKQKKGLFIDSFFDLNPEDILLIMHQGKIILFDESILSQLEQWGFDFSVFSRILMQGNYKYLLGDIGALISHINNYYPDMQWPLTMA